MIEPLFISEEDAAESIGVKPATLRTWRHLNRGPDWHVNPDTGRFIGYTKDDLDAWKAAGKRDKETN